VENFTESLELRSQSLAKAEQQQCQEQPPSWEIRRNRRTKHCQRRVHQEWKEYRFRSYLDEAWR